MDYISTLKNSISTSVNIELFKNKEDAIFAHIYKSKLVKIPISTFEDFKVGNFNSDRLQKSAVKAYPLTDRPRGADDISSVKYHQKQIQHKKDIMPIWMVQQNGKYILLDGAHRIVASYIEDTKYIYAYIINV